MRLRRLGISIPFAILVATVMAQEPIPVLSDDPAPTFRTGVEAVAVDVFVTDAAGTAVPGLTIDDFQLEENGKPLPITTFRAMNIPLEATAFDGAIPEPDVSANDRPEGRTYVFAIAVADPCQALRTRAFLRQFLDRHFGPDDIAAVVILGRGLSTDGQDFTHSRRLLLAAIDKLSGGFGECGSSGGDSRVLSRVLTQALLEVVQVLERMAGHKSMLFFHDYSSSSFPWADLIDYRGGVGTQLFDEAHLAMTVATRSHLTIYPIDPRGLTTGLTIAGPQDLTSPTDSELAKRMDFRALGEITGGFAHVGSNDFAGAFARIARDASTYYMLGFNSGYAKNDGRFVPLTVRVKRPGLVVRTRSGYVNATRREYQARQSRGGRRAPLAEALASPVATPGHPMRLAASPFRQANGSASLVLMIETGLEAPARSSRDSAARRFQIRYLATDAKRRIYSEIRHSGTYSTPASSPPGADARVRLISELELPPGRYQIRAAAGDPVGGVVHDVEVPDFDKAPLALSGVLLASAGESMPTVVAAADRKKVKSRTCDRGECAAPDSRQVATALWSASSLRQTPRLFTPLGAPPTTARTFRQDDVLIVFSELYENTAPRQVEVRVALARGADEEAVHAQAIATTRPGGRTGTHPVRVELPLARVAPGRYVLRVQARAAAEGDEASREIPIEIAP